MENTLLIIKPDSIRNKNIGKIINIIENNNMNILYLTMLNLNTEVAKEFYYEHKDKSFYEELTNFIISGPIIVIILNGENVIKNLRVLIGNTNFKEASDKTIRKLFASSVTENAVHASDSILSFEREKEILFNYIKKCNQKLITGK